MENKTDNERWEEVEAFFVKNFDTEKHPAIDTLLFLIGVQELGAGKQTFTKEQKQDLMHIAICTLLAQSGYYINEGRDEDGWPHFKQLKPLPEFNVIEQENFLKDHVLLYFDNQEII